MNAPLTLAILLLLVATVVDARARTYEGRAHDIETGDWVYTERHVEWEETGRERVLSTRYETPDGRLIAERHARFESTLSRPQFELRVHPTGLVEGAQVRADSVRVYRRAAAHAKVRESELALASVDVIDAGFVHFIRSHWNALTAGRPVEFNFLLPSRLSAVPMRLSRVEENAPGFEPTLTVRLEPRNALLRWLVEPIEVTLRERDRSLQRYVGISNIPNGRGGNHRVRIEFGPVAETPHAVGAETSRSTFAVANRIQHREARPGVPPEPIGPGGAPKPDRTWIRARTR